MEGGVARYQQTDGTRDAPTQRGRFRCPLLQTAIVTIFGVVVLLVSPIIFFLFSPGLTKALRIQISFAPTTGSKANVPPDVVSTCATLSWAIIGA